MLSGNIKQAFGFVIFLTLIPGCSTVGPFKEGLEAKSKNLSFELQAIEMPTLAASLGGTLYIYKADAACKLKNRGSIEHQSGKAPVGFGLAPGLHYFRIVQAEYSLLTNTMQREQTDFRFEVKPGKNYAVSYIVNKSLAGNKIIERDLATGQTKEIHGEPWSRCGEQLPR